MLLFVCGCGPSSVVSGVVEPEPTHDARSYSPQPADTPRPVDSPSRVEADASQDSPSNHIAFNDLAIECGIDFVFQTGAKGKYLMPEATGGGAAWIDYDRDGSYDLFLVQGGDPLAESIAPGTGDRLYRSNHRETQLQFTNVTGGAFIYDSGYGQGVAIADFNDDGFEDIYVTNIRENVLMQNQGDGTFKNVTNRSGTGDQRWSTSAAWGDLDGDGDLDLYVCNYLDYDVRAPFPCYSESGKPAMCHPSDLNAVENACFENLGDGTFRDRLTDWNLQADDSKSLGVVIADFNLDGRSDIYVANDVTPNLLFLAEEERGFSEKAIGLGCAMSGSGLSQASMGIACEDYDGNGLPDLYVTHFSADSNTLYANLGHGFRDVTRRQGLHKPTLDYLGFGCSMLDFDCNGFLDLFIANGHVNYGLEGSMVPQLFSYNGSRWTESSSDSSCFSVPRLGRAVAQCDVDQDGLPDLAVVNQLENTSLLVNRSEHQNWLNVDLVGSHCNRRGLGARVVLTLGDKRVTRQLTSGGSYCSSHQPRIFFGLGDWDKPCMVTVHWPHSKQITEVEVEPNQLISIQQPIEGDSPE